MGVVEFISPRLSLNFLFILDLNLQCNFIGYHMRSHAFLENKLNTLPLIPCGC
jgi:hypothetical protein